MDLTLILTVALFATLLIFLLWKAEVSERREAAHRRPTAFDLETTAKETLSQARAILENHWRSGTIGEAEAIVAQAARNRKK